MRVYLRHALTGFFYAGPHCCVNSPERARDLGTMENAVEIAREEDFGEMEAVAAFDDTACEWVIGLGKLFNSSRQLQGKRQARAAPGFQGKVG